MDKKMDFLWKVLGRIDSYINLANQKAGFVVTFNTIFIGWVGVTLAQETGKLGIWSLLGLAIVFLLGAISFAIALKVVLPDLSSNSSPLDYHSAIFFEDIAAQNSRNSFLNHIQSKDEQSLLEDTAFQAHLLAGILKKKMDALKVCFVINAYLILPLTFITVLLMGFKK
jgi:hypothetical protein